MVATHGGIVVPPRDGDGSSSEDGDGLVAQIIPLRHRGREADEQPPPRTSAQELAEDDLPPSASYASARGERSVWDQPTAELRRRADPGSTRASSSSGAGDRRLTAPRPRRLLAAAAAVTLGVVALAIVFSSALQGQRPAIRHAGSALRASSTVNTRSPVANGSAARRSRHAQSAAGARHQQRPHRSGLDLHRQRGSAPAARGAASGPAVSDAEAGTPTSALVDQTAASGAGSAPATTPSESAPAQAQVAPEPSASTPSTPQNQCVPGELGC